MAKHKKGAIVDVTTHGQGDVSEGGTVTDSSEDNNPATVLLKCPIGEIGKEFIPRYTHAQVGALTKTEAFGLKRLARGLEDSGVKLANGKLIDSSPKAIRWLLQEIGTLAVRIA